MGKHTRETVEAQPKGASGKPSEHSMCIREVALPADRKEKPQFHIYINTIVSFSSQKKGKGKQGNNPTLPPPTLRPPGVRPPLPSASPLSHAHHQVYVFFSLDYLRRPHAYEGQDSRQHRRRLPPQRRFPASWRRPTRAHHLMHDYISHDCQPSFSVYGTRDWEGREPQPPGLHKVSQGTRPHQFSSRTPPPRSKNKKGPQQGFVSTQHKM